MDNEELTKQLLNEFDNSIENLKDDDEIENNNDDETNCNASGLFILIFAWIEGLRTGSRLVWIPSEEAIYYSNAINKKHNAIACTCYIKGCNARILILNDGTAASETRTANHNHGSLYNIYKERFLYTYMKERCRSAPASALIRDIYNEAVLL